jgi:hypothetical protein
MADGEKGQRPVLVAIVEVHAAGDMVLGGPELAKPE